MKPTGRASSENGRGPYGKEGMGSHQRVGYQKRKEQANFHRKLPNDLNTATARTLTLERAS